MKKYWIIDIFGNEKEVTELEYYKHLVAFKLVIIGLLISLIGLFIDFL